MMIPERYPIKIRYKRQYPKNQYIPVNAIIHALIATTTKALKIGLKPFSFVMKMMRKMIISVVTTAHELTKA